MAEWLEWARGPMFRFALMLMILGLARLVVVTVVDIGRAWYNAGDRRLPLKDIVKATLLWLSRIRKIEDRPVYVVASTVFHMGFIVVAVFSAAHVALWRRGIGFGWPSIGPRVADVLTIAAVAAAVVLLVLRVGTKEGRGISLPGDYLLLLLAAAPMVSGFLAAHPSINPVPFHAMMFLHVMSANLVMIMIPFTKLSHVVLLPFSQVLSELAWHFTPRAGEKVAAALGKEGEPI